MVTIGIDVLKKLLKATLCVLLPSRGRSMLEMMKVVIDVVEAACIFRGF